MGLSASPSSSPAGGHIVGKYADFLCLGGASLFIVPAVYLMPDAATPLLVALMWMLADVLNHPHFAASYMIFYRGFDRKLAGEGIKPALRYRYIFAGVVAPVALALFFATGLVLGNAALLGWAGNLMVFLVGWHYTKQGYGMLMVDAVMKKKFFSAPEKHVLLINAYACWILFWLAMNWYISDRQMWGLHYYSFDIPVWMLAVAGFGVAATTVQVLAVFVRRIVKGGLSALPVTGVMAYLVSLYFWAVARFDPMALMFVPALHSLQYLTIVWRFEKNRGHALNDAGTTKGLLSSHVLKFGVAAFLIGWAGFYTVPRALDTFAPYDVALLGPTAFMFVFWMFINIHHYLIDNVIWRSDNPEAGRYLFIRS
jgi:hypothetical protein